MKILTLTQPWATLMAVGAKHIETRSWRTRYRGPVAIHAAKIFPPDCRALCLRPGSPILQTLARHGIESLAPLKAVVGHIVAVVDLVDICSTDLDLSLMAARSLYGIPDERHFGNYSPGRFAWITRNVRRLARPIPFRGSLGLRDLPAAVEAALRLHLERSIVGNTP